MQGATPDEAALEKLQEAIGYLNTDLGDGDYAVGDAITLADIALAASVLTVQECGIDLSENENVTAWLGRCGENMAGYEEINVSGAKMFGGLFKSKLE